MCHIPETEPKNITIYIQVKYYYCYTFNTILLFTSQNTGPNDWLSPSQCSMSMQKWALQSQAALHATEDGVRSCDRPWELYAETRRPGPGPLPGPKGKICYVCPAFPKKKGSPEVSSAAAWCWFELPDTKLQFGCSILDLIVCCASH